MNLALRKAVKAEVIDHVQHDAIMAGAAKPEPVTELDPESWFFLTTWQGFGSTIAAGMMGVMDLRAMQTPAREAWIEREVVAYGDNPDEYRIVWAALDDWAYEQAMKALSSKGGDDG